MGTPAVAAPRKAARVNPPLGLGQYYKSSPPRSQASKGVARRGRLARPAGAARVLRNFMVPFGRARGTAPRTRSPRARREPAREMRSRTQNIPAAVLVMALVNRLWPAHERYARTP